MYMLSFLTSFLGKGFIGQITGALSKAYKDRLEAQNDEDRIKLEGDIALLNTQREIMVSEMNHSRTSWVRPSFCFIFLVYIAKTVIYDKVLGLGVTDALSAQQEFIMYGFLGVYFVGRTIEKVFKK